MFKALGQYEHLGISRQFHQITSKMSSGSGSDYYDDDNGVPGDSDNDSQERQGEPLHHLSGKLKKVTVEEIKNYRTWDKGKPPFTFNMLVLLAVAALSDTPEARELGGVQLKVC